MVCLVACALAPIRVAAQPLPIAWHAPPGCPSLNDVSSWLEAVVPAELRTRLAGITAEVRITRVGRSYHADIRVTHGTWSGEREVEGRRCEEVARSAIVVVSVSLAEAVEIVAPPPDVPPVVPETPEEPPVTDVVAPPVTPTPIAPVVPVEAQPEAAAPLPTLILDAAVGLVLGFGTNDVAPGLALGVHRPLHRNVTLGLHARAVPRTEATRAEAAARLALVVVGVEGCGRHAIARMFHVASCLRIEAGATVAEGEGIEQTLRGRAPFVAVALTPAIELGARYRLRLSGSLDARLVRPRLEVEGIGTLYRSPKVGGSIDLGLVILIP